MRILLYEFVTGGGWYSQREAQLPASLTFEGLAMVRALAADFAAVDGATVEVLRDVRHRGELLAGCTVHEVASAEEEREALERLAVTADWCLVIAPEFCGNLHDRCRLVERAGGRLLGPSSRVVALASDKHLLALHLAERQVPVPDGLAIAPFERLPEAFTYPAVLKPRDGAGSQGIEWIESPIGVANGPAPARLERWCAGIPASVAFLCEPSGAVALPPCRQRLSGDRRFAYLGGSVPIEPCEARRAAGLAARAVATLDDPRGYLGVDLILGPDDSGADDVVIEINPRMTTSYVGLRALARGNLAAAMLAMAEGRQVELSWQRGPIQFEATGQLRRAGDA